MSKQDKQAKPKRAQSHNRKAQNVGAFSGYIIFYMAAVVLTKIFGFLREIMITAKFGYGVVSDGYILGFSIPDLVYNMLIAGALSAAVVPMLSASIERDEEDKLWPSLSSFFTLIIVIFFGFMLVGLIFAPELLRWLNPDQSLEVLNIATSVSRVIYLQTFLFILIAISRAVISANKVYGLPALGDSIYNVFGFLAVAILGAPSEAGAIRVSWGIVFAALIYFLYMNYFGRPYMTKFKPRIKVKDRVLGRLVWLAVPSLLAGTVRQLNTIIQQRFTSGISGAVTSLKNANTLFNLPYQIIINSVGTFLLPNISGFLARDAKKEASDFLSTTIRIAIFILMPASVLFFVFPEETVRAVFQWNPASYTDANVASTATILRIFAIELLITAFIYFVNQVFYAVQKNYITLITTILSFAFNGLFLWLYIDVMAIGIEGLALASLSYNIVIAIVSYIFMKKVTPDLKFTGMGKFLVKGFISAFFTYAVLVLAGTLMQVTGNKWLQLVQYIIYGLVTVGAYFAAASALKMPEVGGLIRMVRRLFEKVKGRIGKVEA